MDLVESSAAQGNTTENQASNKSMIGEILLFLTHQLSRYLNERYRRGSAPRDDQVVLLDGEKMNPIRFKLGAITALLINLEEENVLRGAEPYRRQLPDGTKLMVRPEIRLNLYVLFVAHYKQYDQGLQSLSRIIRFFQNRRVLDHENSPDLNPGIDRLLVELVTLPFSEQNEIWNTLRTTYHPSALYKVSLVVFQDEEAFTIPEVIEKDLRFSP